MWIYLRTALVWLCFLGLGLAGGYGIQYLNSPAASAPELRLVDRSTPGLPAADKLVLVSLSTCPACAQAREWLGAQGQEYVELAVDKSPEAKALAKRLGIDAVPVLIVGDRSIKGFDGETFEREIKAWRTGLTPSA